jgi:hypothetical protein
MEEVELARDEAANQWIDENVQEGIVASLQSWARRMIDVHDEDDTASIGVLLLDAREMRTTVDAPSIRAYTYGLIFQWDDGRKGVVCRSALRTDDSNQVVEFIPVDNGTEAG